MTPDRSPFRPPSETLPPLFPNLQIPDLSEADSDPRERNFIIETEIVIDDTAIPCCITIQRFKEDRAGYGNDFQRAQLHIELFRPGSDLRIGVYKGALCVERPSQQSPVRDGNVHQVWRIYTRKIDERLRGAGLGTASLRAFEEIAQRMAEAYPLLKAEWIELLTSLTSLTKMAISQDWLEDHGLDRYKKSSGPDFGYIPRSEDEYNVKTVLSAGSTSLDTIPSYVPQICLYKKMSQR